MAYKVKGIFKGLKVFSRIFGKRAFYFLSRLKSSTSTLAMHVRWSSCLFVARLFPPWIVLAAVKEHEMEIGYQTDVKHVAHIGWDNASVTAPSWVTASIPPAITPFQCTTHVRSPTNGSGCACAADERIQGFAGDGERRRF